MTKRALVLTFSTLALGSVIAVGMGACTSNSAKAKPKYIFKDAPNATAVAKIGDEEITLDQLIGEAKLDYIEIKKKEYQFKLDRLNALLKQRLIGQQAKKANLSLDDFIAKKVAKQANKVTDKEYQKFVKDKKIPESQINDSLKGRIMTFLKEEKKKTMVNSYLAKLTRKTPVEVYFRKPKLAIQVDVGTSPLWGKKNAKITIVEFSDFQCPFCARANDTVNRIKKKYRGKIKLAFKHFPLSFHRQAKPAAEASMCINEQGQAKFWKFHDILFKNQKALDDASLEKYAKQAGADVKKYKECYAAKKYAAAVQSDIEYGDKLGVRSTPTFFINGELVSGAVPFEQFRDVIEEALSDG